ncbi:MAG: AraC family transcriptional regulator, partial [Rhizobium sp.]
MDNSREQRYARRFGQVLDFIDRHLDEDLSVERLGEVAHFSMFHFHRQFTNYVGITPARYVQLARLRRASYRLAFNPLEPITDIAFEAGFERLESFSRAFKSAFGQSPSTFRKAPDWAAWSAQFQLISPREIEVMQVRIITIEPAAVAVLEHRGDPARLNDSVQKFIAWRKATGLSPVLS